MKQGWDDRRYPREQHAANKTAAGCFPMRGLGGYTDRVDTGRDQHIYPSSASTGTAPQSQTAQKKNERKSDRFVKPSNRDSERSREYRWRYRGFITGLCYPLSRDSQTQPSSVTLTMAPGLLPGTRAWPGPEERPWRTGSSGFKADMEGYLEPLVPGRAPKTCVCGTWGHG